MFCTKCGSQVQAGADFCPSCGNKMASRLQQQPGVWQAPPPPPPGGPYAPPPGQAGAPGAARPAGSAGELDFGRIFSYLFKDPDWVKKVLMLALMMIIPIVGWLVIYGYMVETAQNVFEGRDVPLPEFDFGRQLSVGFTYILPVFCLGGIVFIVAFVAGLMTRIPVAGILANLLVFAFQIFIAFYSMCAVSLQICERNPWGIFQIDRCLSALKSNLLNVFLSMLIFIPIIIIGCAGVIGLVIGVLFTMPMAGLMMSSVYGQLGIILKKSVG